jgi:hypothetical protein
VKATPPKADELEVSVFGPGYGECVLVHLGEGQWMIVDSCKDQRSREQPALRYLDDIGVDPGASVRVVVGTHWHRDHVRGLTEVVGRCVNSDFWTSEALTSREALVLTGKIAATELTNQSPLRELHGVLERLLIRSEGTRTSTIKTAVADSVIYRRVRGGQTVAEVTALSPHSDAVAFTRESFRAIIEDESPGTFRAPDIHPNHAAIALLVRVNSNVAVLGSDLENDAPGGGWAGIVANHHPTNKASIFKVPHHGSVTGHEPSVWQTMLQSNVVATVTPFRPGRLPRLDMAQAIVDLSGQSLLAAPPTAPKQRQRPRRTRALMRGSAVRVDEIEGRSGHIRVRCQSDSGNSSHAVVDLQLPALRLESLLST